VVADLRDAARPRLAVFALDRLERSAGGLFRSFCLWLRLHLYDGPVDFCRRRLPHFVGDVGVDIQRCGTGDVANNGGQGLDVHAMLQGVGGECVSEVVEADMLAARPLQDDGQLLSDSSRVPRRIFLSG